MLMQKPTPEMIEMWKEVWKDFKDKLRPNRKTGKEIVGYLKNKYFLEELHDDNAKQVVINNILYNKQYANRLTVGAEPSVVTFIVVNEDDGKLLYDNQDEIFKGSNIFVGVELETGFFLLKVVVTFGMNYMYLED
jgi:hypothetical protein